MSGCEGEMTTGKGAERRSADKQGGKGRRDFSFLKKKRGEQAARKGENERSDRCLEVNPK